MIDSSAVTRRKMLQVGALGCGLTLSDWLRVAEARGESATRGRSAILVFLKGGPSHLDTFDLKPDAPAEIRGSFRAISSSVPGLQVCEHLPRLAARAQHYSVIRGISHNLAAHNLGTQYLMTGNRPLATLRFPAYGSVAGARLDGPPDLPRYVAIDRPLEGPGYLGAEFGALATGDKPRFGQPFRVRGISLENGLSIDRYRSRNQLLNDVDIAFRGFEQLDDHVKGLDRFSRQAMQIISSPRARDAFDLSLEAPRVVERFGRHEFGQSLLLAYRLIRAGVRFVTVVIEDWDTHQDNFNELAGRLLPAFDTALAALFDTLDEQNLLGETAVMVTGEFGRTPKINGRAGRDHWARAMFALMAGGHVSGGRTLGATNDKGEEPVGDGFRPDDLAATFYQNIGIDPATEFQTDLGRPITLVRDGRVIDELVK